MATLETHIKNMAAAIAADVKTLTGNQGSLAALTTTQKTSLVAAVNELKAAVDGAVAGSGAQIDDASTANTKTWSAAKISTQITTAINALINGAGPALDTLGELATQLADDQSALSALTTAVSNRVRFDAAQALTAEQQLQAGANIGLGNTDADLLAHYIAAKA
jgi:hypothetical protein